MPEIHKTIKVVIPAAAPFDTNSFLETFAGEYILPIEDKLKRFWFSRYATENARHILFRFSVESLDELEAHFSAINDKFGPASLEDYNYVEDLGGRRFLGVNARSQNREKRADLVYDFLTSSARLFLASIVKTPQGRWEHETEKESGLNRHTSLESVHHLFCNMTEVPLYAVLFTLENSSQTVIGDMYARNMIQANPSWRYQFFPIRH